MGKITSLDEALEKYKGGGNNEFFTLAQDRESATVRFLHEGDLKKDREWFIVHPVEIASKKRWVLCTEEGDCPLCTSGNRAQLKLFLQLDDKRDGKVKTWERGQKFIPKVQGLISKYGDLCNRPYEIERHGKKGDTQTTYELYALDKDDKTLADLPAPQELLGKDGFILQKTHSEMQEIIDGTFKPTGVEPSRREAPAEKKGSDIF